MRRLFTTMLLATALAAPAALAQQSPAAKPGQQSGQESAKVPSRIQLTSANAIAGRTVNNRKGDEVGEVEYLLIDPQNGKVRYALIGSGGLFDIGEDITPVPWSSLIVTPGEYSSTVTLNAELDTLRQGRRFSRDDIQRLTEPTLITQVYGLYAPQAQTSQQSLGTSNPQDTQGGSGSSGTAGQKQPQGQTQPSNQAAGSGSGSGQPMVLVGREFITMLAPPTLMSPDEIRGSMVTTTTGEDIGDIDRVMVDIKGGQVPYVLVGRGGFLGVGEEWLPVPFQALSWSATNEGFVLNADEQQLRQMQGLRKEDLPARVRTSDLQKLYDRFGVQPYWTKQRG
ncbi:PRC-barrel domain-containing protein [Azospirillum aestuarii]|uniref:PRC-barrel domain-containing protein n=1 Tax=Azospirillum aestuarii TaxID=2802052 RepID=UPI00405531DB